MKGIENPVGAEYLIPYLVEGINSNIDFMNSSFTATFRSTNQEKNEKNLQIFNVCPFVNSLWIK
jgi:hypothetical protein